MSSTVIPSVLVHGWSAAVTRLRRRSSITSMPICFAAFSSSTSRISDSIAHGPR